MKITYDNITKEFELFTPIGKNYIKILLKHQFCGTQELYACLNPIDVEDYEKHVTDVDKFRIVNLRDQSIGEVPFGAILPVRFNGIGLPICDLSLLKGSLIVDDQNTIF